MEALTPAHMMARYQVTMKFKAGMMNRVCIFLIIMLIQNAVAAQEFLSSHDRRERSSTASSPIDFESFLAQLDMAWDRILNRWEIAPYVGNGNVGFLFYQAKGEAKNVISLYTGRHDYYDHRLPHNGNENLWIYRSRLPLGHFNLQSRGDIAGVDLRLDLWNAELAGTVTTSRGSYKIQGLSHSETDVIYLATDAAGGESITITWHPDDPIGPVRKTLERGGPKGASWDRMRAAPYPRALKYTLGREDGIEFCFQSLYKNRGETTTCWEVSGGADGKQTLMASVHHSFPERNSIAIVKQHDDGTYEVDVVKDDSVILALGDLSETDLSIAPIPVSESNRNLFGLSKKTKRLPGHAYYLKRSRPMEEWRRPDVH